MRIAVIEHVAGGDYTEYLFSLIQEQARLHNYQARAWSRSVPASQQKVDDNTIVLISIENKTTFFLNWMYRVKIPSILKKIKADVVIDLVRIGALQHALLHFEFS